MSLFVKLRTLLRFWRSLVIVLAPVVLLPIVFQGDQDTRRAFRCAYVMLLMATYWVTEALPLAVTAFMPIALMPILGVMSTTDVGKEYIKETSLMFMAGLIVAIAVEHCNLHKRIALRLMIAIGTGPRSLMFGFMLPTMLLSMWMSNAACTAMMVPIVQAVVTELESEEEEFGGDEKPSANGQNQSSTEAIAIEMKGSSAKRTSSSTRLSQIKVMFFLSVAYASNTGGTGTLTGTGSNLVLKGVLAEMSDQTPVNFATWMAYSVPMVLMTTFLCWLWLQAWFMGFGSTWTAIKEWTSSCIRRNKDKHGRTAEEIKVMDMLLKKYDELGAIDFHETGVLSMFILLISLWLFRNPKFFKGWGNFVKIDTHHYKAVDPSCLENCTFIRYVEEKDAVDDATAGMLVVLLLFMLPSKLNFWPFNTGFGAPSRSLPSPALLQWQAVHEKMPWALVILFGGGFALAKATNVSGLSPLLGDQLRSMLENLSPAGLVILICIFTAAATEITSNAATCSILLPVLRDLALSLRLNPLFLMLPATLSCAYAFMLPVANPPNAIVYAVSGMKTSDMLKCGFFFNAVCIFVNVSALYIYGIPLFGMDEFPSWAEELRAVQHFSDVQNVTHALS